MACNQAGLVYNGEALYRDLMPMRRITDLEKWTAVAEVVLPIFAAVFLGMYARRKNLMTAQQNQGLQQFVMKFGLPCVLFNSTLTASIGAEALVSMAVLLPLMLFSTFWSFHARKKQYPYHNLPMMFSAQESGMLGIPLYMTLFGAAQAYRMGVLDMVQQLTAIPTIAILAASAGVNPTLREIVGKVVRSPFLLMSLGGLVLNLSGAAAALDSIGVLSVITSVTGFIAQPVSAVMLFSVGFNFAISEGNKDIIRRISLVHLALFALSGLAMQAILLFVPGVEAETRWAILMYTTLPASYLSSSLGRTEDEASMAAGVCSLLTVVSLAVFCVAAFFVA